jgi:acyl-CoA thioester hydrolase
MSKNQPDSRDQYRHFHTITTRWMDNDVYRHVNNVVYYSFFDTAVNEYMLSKGILSLDGAKVVCLVVDTGCQFFSAISFPDIVHCGLRVAHIGRSSVRYEIGIFRNDEATAVAQGHFVHVACDAGTHRPVQIPDDMRRAFEALRVAPAA